MSECVEKYPRTTIRVNTGTTCICARKQLLYSEVDAVEQKDMVNSGARGKKDRHLRTEVDCKRLEPIMFKYLR